MRERALFFVLGLVARLAVVLWAGNAFLPAGDGYYYDIYARRLAEGHGYTWVWADGTVTYAAHYPVGYPALLALPYLVFGAKPIVAGVVNALIGSLAAVTVHAMSIPGRQARIAAAIVALHPALVLYTPAVMTEGIATSLVVCAAALANAKWRLPVRLGLAAAVLGIATLVRPQSILLAPILGACMTSSWRARAIAAGAALLVAIGICAPWTIRNCQKMHRCALVSVNAGWNLLIGTQTENGAWQEVDVPGECRTVWDEAQKDVCFESAAERAIATHPGSWLRRVPAKLSATLDYFGAGPWYLHASNPDRFSDRAKWWMGALETLVWRAVLFVGLVWRSVLLHRDRRTAIEIVTAGGALLCFAEHWGWLAHLVLAVIVLVERPRIFSEMFGAFVILSTAAIHAAFFGAGRYGLLVVPFVTLLCVNARDDAEHRPDHTAK